MCHHAPSEDITPLFLSLISPGNYEHEAEFPTLQKTMHTLEEYGIYRDADFEMANDLLDNTPQASPLNSVDANTSWINWK